MRLIKRVRKTGFTIAPEAGSQRLRDVINKGVTESDLLQTAEAAFRSGLERAPDSVLLKRNLAVTYAKRGELEKAKELLTQGVIGEVMTQVRHLLEQLVTDTATGQCAI